MPDTVRHGWHAGAVRRSTPSSTAQNVALARSYLTWLGVLDDPFAQAMLRPRWALMDKVLRRPVAAWWGRNRTFSWLAARTRFYDDAVTEALDAGIRQVVVVGAGYDSRAWRLARDGVRFFEVDHPATQADKRGRAPENGPCYVPVELGVDALHEALPSAGFRTDRPSLFLAEGLTMYLTEPQVRDLLGALHRLGAPGSRLAVNFGLGVEAAAERRGRAGAAFHAVALALSGEHVHFRPTPGHATEVLTATGWTPERTHTAPELIRRYLTGSGLPVSGVRPTAFAMTASTG
jgi:methyltransferase (TIGR00027 family)